MVKVGLKNKTSSNHQEKGRSSKRKAVKKNDEVRREVHEKIFRIRENLNPETIRISSKKSIRRRLISSRMII